jgi:hypothetical protein
MGTIGKKKVLEKMLLIVLYQGTVFPSRMKMTWGIKEG